jgi:hypothetical protein
MSANPDVVATGLPSDLLENRPDVKAAELRLEASKFDTGAQRRASTRRCASTPASASSRSTRAHLIATPQSLVANLAGNLMAPLLNRAAIKADYRSANARQIQAVFDYERSILQAYTDVYNQLTAISNLRQRFEQLSQQVAALHAAIEVSKALYQSAQVDYYEVLMTVRDSLEAEMELVEAKKEEAIYHQPCRPSSRSTRRWAAAGVTGGETRECDDRWLIRPASQASRQLTNPLRSSATGAGSAAPPTGGSTATGTAASAARGDLTSWVAALPSPATTPLSPGSQATRTRRAVKRAK